MKKKLIFFDGDGTLWYPESTKHTVAPHWIYSDKTIGKDYLKHMVIIPSVLQIFRKLKKRGISIVLLSAHPHSPEKAMLLLKSKVLHFKLGDFFDSYYASKNHPDEKGKMMVSILKEKGVSKSQALMVGDSYKYDYLSAKKVGIDALLIKTDYMKHPARGRKISKTIENIKDVLKYI